MSKKADGDAVLQLQLNAARRMLWLKRAQTDFMAYCHVMMPDPAHPDDPDKSRFIPAAHHRCIGQALERVFDGSILRLAISMPPQHGKSEETTRLFPTWCMGRMPHWATILAGYSESFALTEFGMKIKAYMGSNNYHQMFPGADLMLESKASGNILTTEGGSITSVGRGGSVLGRGADLFVIDDPLKDDEEANSQLIRNKLWDWFVSTAYTRMRPSGRIIIIQQRWSPDDLIGRLLDPSSDYYNEKIAKQWTYLKIPAQITTPEMSEALGIPLGNFLWEERYPKEFYESIKAMSSRVWNAMYMQEPSPDEGVFFTRDMIVPYKPEDLPKNLRNYATSDHAVSSAQRNDSTVMLTGGVDENGEIWILPEIFWDREDDTSVIVEEMIALMRIHKPVYWWAERGHISKSIGPFLQKRMQEELKAGTGGWCVMDDSMVPTKDKKTRARAIHAMMSMKRVHFPTFAPWWADAEHELLRFDGLTQPHDDFVDALSWLGIGLVREIPATAAEPRREGKVIQVGSLAWVKHRANQERRELQQKAADGW